MPLEPTVVLLMLLAAVLHATWNALVKGSRDPLMTQALGGDLDVQGIANSEAKASRELRR